MKKNLLLLLVALFSAVSASAITNFSAVNDDGVTIYYYLADDNSAYVTAKDNSYNSYSGVVNIPASVSYNAQSYPVSAIAGSAFKNCTGLTAVSIPASVTHIKMLAFSGCSALSAVSLPASLTDIGEYAFENCSSLTQIVLPEGLSAVKGGCFYGCTGLAEVSLPASVSAIGDYAFYRCTDLSSLSIPASVSEIGMHAFDGCSSLSSMALPEGLVDLAESIFANCSQLASVSIPSSVVSICSYAFSGCSALAAISLPDAVRFIGRDVFSSTALYREKSNWSDGALYVGSYLIMTDSSLAPVYAVAPGTVAIAQNAFWGRSVSQVSFPASLRAVGISSFYQCKSLVSVVLPQNFETIYDYAFEDCPSLVSVSIPASVSAIGDYAFRKCTALASVSVGSPDPVTIALGTNVFAGVDLPAATLTVPVGAKALYSQAPQWCDFGTILEDAAASVPSLLPDSSLGSPAPLYFDLSGRPVDPAVAAPGLYIRRQGASSAKILIK